MKNVLILAGPSGVGKTTVAEALLNKEGSEYSLVRSITTREKRGDGFDDEYIYSDREEFLRRVEGGEILEYTEYAGQLYGTPRSEIERILSEGKTPLLILDLNGVVSFSKNKGDLSPCAIYVLAGVATLNMRLIERYRADKKFNFVLRSLSNKIDFKRMKKLISLFYYVADNSGELDSTRQSVEAAFSQFKSGVLPDKKANKKSFKEILSK